MSSSSSSSLVVLYLLVVVVVVASNQSEDHYPKRQPLTPLEEEQLLHFQQYLRISTAHPSPDYTSAVSFLTSLSHSLNLTTTPNNNSITLRLLHFTPKPIFLLTWLGSSPSLPSLLLTSHLDSVPPTTDPSPSPSPSPSPWIHPPFSATRDPANGRVFARGSQDDKCLVIQHLHALSSLLRRGFRPIRTVHVAAVPDEEIGGADGMAKLAASPEFESMRVGFAMDEGQASPTSELRVFRGDRVPWWLVVRARGHATWRIPLAEEEEVEVAAENLSEMLEEVGRFRAEQFAKVKAGEKPPSEVVSVNPVYIKAGIPSFEGFVFNMQPSEAEVGFDMRLPPSVDPDQMRRRIAEWAPNSKNLTYEIFERGPMRDNAGRPLMTETNDSNMWWVAFKEAIHVAGGKLAKPEILPSTTDARFLRQKGIPTLGFSPMVNTPILLHEHNEFLQDTVFLDGIKIYEHVIQTLSSLPDKTSSQA